MTTKIRVASPGKTVIPIVYFLLLSIYWFYDSLSQQQNYNYLALTIAAILVTQIILKNKLFGISLGILGVIGSLLMFLAVLSEFNEFKVISESAKQLIVVGTVLSVAGMIMATIITTTNFRLFLK
jgi:uncharacterized membrane protein YdcZ (DUF606 family)